MKTYNCRVLADSIGPNRVRLTTLELTYPRIIHGEIMTHRMFSRNAASSRAIPVNKMIDDVINNPYVPKHWGVNQRGMQAEKEHTDPEIIKQLEVEWLIARDNAVHVAKKLVELNLHKQITNRLLEPFQWYTIIVTATEWDNFINLRTHKDAHPDIQEIAGLVKDELNLSVPNLLNLDEWHLPLIQPDELNTFSTEDLIKISVGRCARVSYLTHDGVRDPNKDIELFKRLLENGHYSPFEHVATPIGWFGDGLMVPYELRNLRLIPSYKLWSGNFRGWKQYRKCIANEFNPLGGSDSYSVPKVSKIEKIINKVSNGLSSILSKIY